MKLKNPFKKKAIGRIENLIGEIENINPEAGKVIKKKMNLLADATADTLSALIQTTVRTYSEGGAQSTHLQIPPSEMFMKYYAEQLTFYKKDELAFKYREIGLKLQFYDTLLRRTDLPVEKSLENLVKFDDAYNCFLDIHSETLKELANPPKDTYQTGIY